MTIKTFKNNPNFVSDKLVNIGVPFGYSKGGNISLGIDLDAYWNIIPSIDAQGRFALYPALLTESEGSQLELGANYRLVDKRKKL